MPTPEPSADLCADPVVPLPLSLLRELCDRLDTAPPRFDPDVAAQVRAWQTSHRVLSVPLPPADPGGG
jgi:hypothetical protein